MKVLVPPRVSLNEPNRTAAPWASGHRQDHVGQRRGADGGLISGGVLAAEVSRNRELGDFSMRANDFNARDPLPAGTVGLREEGVSTDVSEGQHSPSIASNPVCSSALALIVATRPDADGRWAVELRSIDAIDFYPRAAS